MSDQVQSMQIDPDNPPIAIIRELLLAAFDGERLRRFCMDRPVFRQVVDEFSPSHGKADMVDELIDFCREGLLWETLLEEVAGENPPQYARFEPKLREWATSGPPEPLRSLATVERADLARQDLEASRQEVDHTVEPPNPQAGPETPKAESEPPRPPSKPPWVWFVLGAAALLALLLLVGLGALLRGCDGPTPTPVVSASAYTVTDTPLPPAPTTVTPSPTVTDTPTTPTEEPPTVTPSPTVTDTPTTPTEEPPTVTPPPTVTDTPTTPTEEPPTVTPPTVTASPTPTNLDENSTWTELSVSWPCVFDGSLPWGARHDGLWCRFGTLRLSIFDKPPEPFGDSFDVWWPKGDTDNIRVLRPGTAYEARFVPIEVDEGDSYGIAIRSEQGVIYRLLYQVSKGEAGLVFDVQLLEEEPGSPPREIVRQKGLALYTERWSDAIVYRLRIERHGAGLVFRWKGGEAPQEWNALYQQPLPEGDEEYEIGLTIGAFAHVEIYEIDVMSSAHAAQTLIPQPGIVIVDDTDPGFQTYQNESPFYREQNLGISGSMIWSSARDKNPSYAEWCTNLEAGDYEVHVHIPVEYGGHGYAIYEIRHAEGVASVPVNQYALRDKWVVLGIFPFNQDRNACVRLSALGEKAWYTGYDAVGWVLQEPDAR